jgi:hypothetical protein
MKLLGSRIPQSHPHSFSQFLLSFPPRSPFLHTSSCMQLLGSHIPQSHPHSVPFFFPPLSQSLTLCTDIGRHGIFCPVFLSHFIATACSAPRFYIFLNPLLWQMVSPDNVFREIPTLRRAALSHTPNRMKSSTFTHTTSVSH